MCVCVCVCVCARACVRVVCDGVPTLQGPTGVKGDPGQVGDRGPVVGHWRGEESGGNGSLLLL